MKIDLFNRSDYIEKDSPLKKDLLRLYGKNDKLTILDIGGCEGEDSIKYSRIFPLSSIFTFEPLPSNQSLIFKNFIKYEIKNAKLIPFAVSNQVGKSNFYISSGHPKDMANNENWDFGNKSSSLLMPDNENMIDWLEFKKEITVKTITLKKFFVEENIEEVDFAHIDVQGAELKVLKGAENQINQIKAIWIEVADVELYKTQPLRLDIENFMKSKGFYLLKSEVHNLFGDQLYVNKKYFKVFTLFSKFNFIKKIKN